jgi:hypothetical protein
MRRSLIFAALSILSAMALASCGEKPPRADPEGERGFGNETPQHPAYGRTLMQSESERIGD